MVFIQLFFFCWKKNSFSSVCKLGVFTFQRISRQIGDRENAIFPANLKTVRIFCAKAPNVGKTFAAPLLAAVRGFLSVICHCNAPSILNFLMRKKNDILCMKRTEL
jgi:hypothetical protein